MQTKSIHFTGERRWISGSVLVLYAALLITVITFHEPWFDEAESWLIARDASFRDMIFTNPHYEGHPPLWWLLLSVPAKLGVPYEPGLKTVQVIFAVLGAALVLFKSPFPLWIRSLLPFTYFLFFQYGVLSRPYSVMFCAFCLAAVTWEERNGRPFRFCLSLCLLCLTSAYGILIAGGIALPWLFEILKAGTMFQNRKRLGAMALLLALAIVLMALIWPRADTFANNPFTPEGTRTNSFLGRLLLFIFCLPAETTFTAFYTNDLFRFFRPTTMQIVIMAAVSAAIWMFAAVLSRNKKTLQYMILPYGVLALFASWKYFWMHHIGIIFFLFLFSAWISYDTDKRIVASKPVAKAIAAAVLVGFLVSISWTLKSSIIDIQAPYSAGRALASFVADNHLESFRWVAEWEQTRDEDENLVHENTHNLHSAVVEANPYFSVPLTGIQADGKSYRDHIIPSPEKMGIEEQELANRGVDFFIGSSAGKAYYCQLGIDEKIELAHSISYDMVWKGEHRYHDLFIIARTEVLDMIG